MVIPRFKRKQRNTWRKDSKAIHFWTWNANLLSNQTTARQSTTNSIQFDECNYNNSLLFLIQRQSFAFQLKIDKLFRISYYIRSFHKLCVYIIFAAIMEKVEFFLSASSDEWSWKIRRIFTNHSTRRCSVVSVENFWVLLALLFLWGVIFKEFQELCTVWKNSYNF